MPVDKALIAPVEVVTLSENFDLPELGAGFKACVVRSQQCNGQLEAIGKIEGTGETGDTP